MGLTDFLSDLLAGTDSQAPVSSLSAGDGSAVIVYECRHCGTTVGSETACCPSCQSENIVEYAIE
ncbi:hypothetical protein ACFOZ7_19780 [Natribaculum luteum]|uniref:Rubrerythrin-like domain-containing protein n=1 Tax=Natribaculum luteum TaxID=1586232 RepID=A0ABD5P480_9EURY|nr:hypothetical protein [Natribaculum luteum]